MAAALQIPLLPDFPDVPDVPDLVPGTLKAWRTKAGVPIGVTGRLSSGEWAAMTPDDDITIHESADDASLHLTLAYMRGPR
jgi:hypothetical protein